MADTPWKKAIEKVMRERGEAMHYAEIAEEIVRTNLRKKVGATPGITVNSQITTDINKNGDESLFLRVARGSYVLRGPGPGGGSSALTRDAEAAELRSGVIRAFGMYWRRDYVNWTSTPSLLGQEQMGAQSVDMAKQVGVYLLYDGREVIYVGRAVDRPLGTRLREHGFDRLSGRWDRFSWFGMSGVTEEGNLESSSPQELRPADLIPTFEGLLIEGLEPRQNRKRADDFRAVEYQQVVDPSIARRRTKQAIVDLLEEKG